MPNTLGLDDDLDDVELLQSLEQTFALRFSQSDAGTFYKVEDIYGFLRDHVEANGLDKRCATSLAFYRLRRALGHRVSGEVLRPSIELAPFAGRSANRLFQKLAHETGLRMPRANSGWIANVGALLCLAALLAILPAAILGWSYWIPVSLFAAAIAAMKNDPGKLPTDCRTLGDLSERVAGLNFAQMQKLGARTRDKDIWNAMVEVMAQHSILPREQIQPETLLLETSLPK